MKITVFNMETPCFGALASLKTFIFSVKLEYIRIGTFLNILVTQKIRQIDIFVHVTCFPETMPTSRIVKFQNKAVHRAEDRPTDICLKMAFT